MLESDSFWRGFMAYNWERVPTHTVKTSEEWPITLETGFAALRKATELHEAGARVPLRALEMGGNNAAIDRQLLPNPSDGSAAQYIERLRVLGRQKPFFVQLPQIHRFDPVLWQRVRDFSALIYKHVGMPAGKAWSDIYIGQYDSTPFGIHLDGASNFTFGLVGKKTLYLWEPDFYERHIKGHDPRDYTRFLHAATELTVNAGEMIYWPARFWHVAASHGDFSVTANVSYYIQDSMADRIGQAIARLIRLQLGPQEVASSFEFDPAQPQKSAAVLPSAIKRAVSAVESLVSNGVLAHNLEIDWLARVSRFGFEGIPILNEVPPLDPASSVRGDKDHPILWHRPGGDLLLLTANGQLMTVPDHPLMQRMMELLNTGQPVRVAALTESPPNVSSGAALPPDKVLEILRQLLRWGAIFQC